MELPDEAVSYQYQSLMLPVGEEWTTAAEIRARYYLQPSRLKELAPRLMQAKSQVVAEREARAVPPEALPIHAGFIDSPSTRKRRTFASLPTRLFRRPSIKIQRKLTPLECSFAAATPSRFSSSLSARMATAAKSKLPPKTSPPV